MPNLNNWAKKWLTLGILLVVVRPAGAGDCTPSTGPDIIVAGLPQIAKFGTVGDITAYAFATDACNIGDEPAAWFAQSTEHPVISQNMYRLRDGQFEQIGMAWPKHAFQAFAQETCCPCEAPGGPFLGIGCSDVYSTAWNGFQQGFGGLFGGLGPRSDINPSTGEFPWPYTTQGDSGDAIYKRLQIKNDDLDPSLNAGALYYIEGQYIAADETAAGNQHNNLAYRRAVVGSFTEGGWNLGLSGGTVAQSSAIVAWQAADTGVRIEHVDVPQDGRLVLGSRCSDNGDGTWHYEYALFNENSDRSAQAFTVFVPPAADLANIGFHDVDHHSGEIYDGTDWQVASPASDDPSITWFTDDWDTNPNANALRWGTLYNFRFDANAPPADIEAVVSMFKPGSPETITIGACGPESPPTGGDHDGDGDVDLFDYEQFLTCETGPDQPPTPGCDVFDFDADNDVDLPDAGAFQRSFTGP